MSHSQRKDSRVDTLLAALALVGEGGVDEASLFARVYGFRYVVARHEGPFRVLVHRARQAIGDAAKLEWTEGQLRLRPSRVIAIADPRCANSIDDRVLRFCAGLPQAATAKEVAEATGVSLRAAQAALRRLTEEGLCLKERNWRSVAYRVEDTTFSEPTFTRLRGQR